MPPLRRARRTGPPLLAATIAGAAAAALLPAAAGAVGAPQQREGRASFDVRSGTLAAAPGEARPAARALQRRLGVEGVVSIDAVTDTPRSVARTDGSLTGPSTAPAAQIALDYVRAHPGVFKLTDADLAALGEPEVVESPVGTRYLRWRQHHNGIPVVGAQLRAQVAADGRLLAVQGSPLPDTSVRWTTPGVSASGALARVRRDVGAGGTIARTRRSFSGPQRRTAFADDSQAQLIVFAGPDGNRLAWNVLTEVDSGHVYAAVVDATTGEVLKRDNLVSHLSGHASAWRTSVRDPLAPVAFEDRWVADGNALRGDFAWTYPDLLDRNAPVRDARGNGGDVPANDPPAGDGKPVWNYSFTPVTTNYDPRDPGRSPGGGYQCSVTWPCSWSSWFAYSWEDNYQQNAVQVHTYVNRFHDHLLQPPIGFDAASGNFEVTTPGGTDGDPVIAETSDGASIDDGYVDDAHSNNANMATYPDMEHPFGRSPRMQMFLFLAGNDPADPTVDGNGGDEAAVVYHEYTHGLSSRLVADSDGWAALNAPQSGAMGEAWSDWYAYDYMTAVGDVAESNDTPGELVLAASLTQGRNWLRTAALDCPVGVAGVETCPGDGGFTYADYGKVWPGGPEVHADGEIWAQTLWDLRIALQREHGEVPGMMTARSLITEAMRGADPEPSFLEMRDRILLADQATGGVDHELIWDVFAARGMGVYADSVTSYDPAPFANFDTPPDPAEGTAPLSGTVTDQATGRAVVGAHVWLPGMSTSVLTDGAGRYTLAAASVDTYPRINVYADGYADAPVPEGGVSVVGGGTTRDVQLRRNWALASGRTTIESATAPDLSDIQCGPADAIDGTRAFGWGSYAPSYQGGGGLPEAPIGDRVLVLRLPQAVDVTSVEIDPGAICGDDDSASLGEFTLETSPDGTDGSWRTAAASTFTRNDNHRLNGFLPEPGTGAAVRYVRVTMLRPQGGWGSSGDFYMDMAELAIYGTATPERKEPPVDPPVDPPRRDPEPPVDPPRDPEPPVQLDRTAPRTVGKPVLPRKRTLTALRSRAGLPLRVRFDETARIAATVTLPAATARKLRLTRARRGSLTLSRASLRSLRARSAGTLRLKLSAAARRRLARTRSLRVTVTIVATDAAGNRARVVVKPLLKR